MTDIQLLPLGVCAIDDKPSGYHFVLCAPLAIQVILCLFDENDHESQYTMQRFGNRWYAKITNIGVGQRYGFRLSGGKQTPDVQQFNPNKLLLDPYAKGVIGKPDLSNDAACTSFLLDDNSDNAAVAPKSVIIDERFDWQDDQPPRTPWEKTVIYELHVKGFTQRHPDIPRAIAGSYHALASPVVITYLRDLGITAVELQPIAYGIDEPHLQKKGLNNYWNYNLLSPFSIETNYHTNESPSDALVAFKTAVKALHTAGIEVILDVVFNHTAEAEDHHPCYHLRGIDKASYYWLNGDNSHANWTGCGNTINANHPITQQWIIDCLCYWVESCHIDGFRFDLGAILGRCPEFSHHAAFFTAIKNEPRLDHIKWIVEPWDISQQGYRLGHFPPLFAEWNDRFRDDSRAFWLHQSGQLGIFAQRFSGSNDIFQTHHKNPHHSINFITAHDGFTLMDLVSYQDKHNIANGENNQDGHNHNLSYHHGVEGPSQDATIIAARRASRHALLATLLLAHGTPMLLAGDELGRSQNGNNNAYCQDNQTTWINWHDIDQTTLSFVKSLIKIRKEINLLQSDRWWCEGDIAWLNANGKPMTVEDWQQTAHKSLQIQLEERLLLLINAKTSAQTFILPTGYWTNLEDGNTASTSLTVSHLSFSIYFQPIKATNEASS